MKRFACLVIPGLVWACAAAPAGAQTAATATGVADQKESRYQIGQMERVLEGAVEHGATTIRDRLQALAPTEMLVSENARVRGFRLEGYGVFFDVVVPTLDTTLTWSLRTLDQNDLGLQSALNALKAHVNADGDTNLQQALQRVELQVSAPPRDTARPVSAASTRGAAAMAAELPSAVDPILTDPDEAYRTEVKQKLTDAMLDFSSALGIGPEEWLTVAARRNEDRPRLGPADSDARTIILRVRGADLTAFRAARLTRDEVVKRIDVRVF